MKFCPVVPEICRGQVHALRKERIRIIIRNGAKTISLQTLFVRLNKNNNKKRSKNNKSPKLCLGDLIIIRNGAKTISLQTLFGRLNNKKRSKNNKFPKLCLGDLINMNQCQIELQMFLDTDIPSVVH